MRGEIHSGHVTSSYAFLQLQMWQTVKESLGSHEAFKDTSGVISYILSTDFMEILIDGHILLTSVLCESKRQ